ncbi:hypothetical protein NC653_011863 [Populus alba x Populus x berolinensis]|uniref:Uncharacterized protein n=1 Tax=Populus alba x Populus x berolinensis TaxID=444605 RepID=A0AAD6W6Z4_9ROSI|nr:hypothetical protein NC653_011863 [Populus alba x Populus x berolinensis]
MEFQIRRWRGPYITKEEGGGGGGASYIIMQ